MPESAPEHNLPLVTVIIASYNHISYIKAAIQSVLCQSYPNIELLVIDDGSSDGSVELLRNLQSHHKFDLRTQPNQGLSRTLNDGIARAKGDLIVPFGSDDIMMPSRIEQQVAYLRNKPEVGICAGNIEVIDANGCMAEERKQRRHRRQTFRRLDFDDLFLGRKAGPPAPTLMFRKNVLLEVGGFDPDIRLEDVYIELAIAHAGYFVDILDEVLAQYREHSSNTYKNHRFMVENVLKTYACFSEHPNYANACAQYRNSMFLKCARHDKSLARKLLTELPLRAWNMKTLRGLWRLGIWRLLLPA